MGDHSPNTHLRLCLSRGLTVHGYRRYFWLIDFLRVPRRPSLDRFLAFKSPSNLITLNCLRRLHADFLGADKRGLSLVEVLEQRPLSSSEQRVAEGEPSNRKPLQ